MAAAGHRSNIACRYPVDGAPCGRPAQGRPTLIIERDGQRRLHWECDGGHKFHTVPDTDGYLHCDCDEPVVADPAKAPARTVRGRFRR